MPPNCTTAQGATLPVPYQPMQTAEADDQEGQVAQHVHRVGQVMPRTVVCEERRARVNARERGTEGGDAPQQQEGAEKTAFTAAETGKLHGKLRKTEENAI